MFELLEVVDRAAFFRRTSAPVFDPLGDGWQMQGYNQRLLLRLVWRERLREFIPASARSAVKDLVRSTVAAALRLVRGPRWSVRILEPQAGDAVGSSGVVRGTGRIPSETRLWLLAWRKDQNGWWPQGDGPSEFSGDEWHQRCNYGGPADVGEEFEIAVVAVNAADQRRLERWVEEGRRSGDYPPIDLPQPGACWPVKLTVAKASRGEMNVGG